MFNLSNQDSGINSSGLAVIGEIFVVLFVILIPVSIAVEYMENRPSLNATKQEPEIEPIGGIQIGPGKLILLNGELIDQAKLYEMLDVLAADANGIVELQGQMPFDGSTHYDIRFHLRNIGYTVRERRPIPAKQKSLKDS